jgi:hypothetical protein
VHRIRRILLVTGSRKAKASHRYLVQEAFDYIQPDLIVHGCCVGFDLLADDEAYQRGYAITRMPVSAEDKKAYGPAAFTMRNTTMVEHIIDTYCELEEMGRFYVPRAGYVVGCVAFPGGAGTNDCARKWLAYKDQQVSEERALGFLDFRAEKLTGVNA